jgi:hypothetical protein
MDVCELICCRNTFAASYILRVVTGSVCGLDSFPVPQRGSCACVQNTTDAPRGTQLNSSRVSRKPPKTSGVRCSGSVDTSVSSTRLHAQACVETCDVRAHSKSSSTPICDRERGGRRERPSCRWGRPFSSAHPAQRSIRTRARECTPSNPFLPAPTTLSPLATASTPSFSVSVPTPEASTPWPELGLRSAPRAVDNALAHHRFYL